MKNIYIIIMVTVVAIVVCFDIGYNIGLKSVSTKIEPVVVNLNVNTVEHIEDPKAVVAEELKQVEVKPVEYSASEAIFESEYSKYKDVDKDDLLALTVALYGEARGESWYGMAAVADTIRNRVKSHMFPDTYYEVVTQRKQFSCILNTDDLYDSAVVRNRIEAKRFRKLIKLAAKTVRGKLKRMTFNALFYHTVSVRPYWSSRYSKLGVIGHHVFYTTNKL